MTVTQSRTLISKVLAVSALVVAFGTIMAFNYYRVKISEERVKTAERDLKLAKLDAAIAEERETHAVQIAMLEKQLEVARLSASIVDDSDRVFAIIDAEGNVKAWSEGAEALFNLSREKAYELNLVSMIPKDLRPIYEKELRQAMAEGQLSGAKYTVEGSDVIPVPVAVTPRPLPGGEVIPTFVVQLAPAAAQEKVEEAVEVEEKKDEAKEEAEKPEANP